MGALGDSSMIHKKLSRLENFIVTTSQYLEKYPAPSRPEDLIKHQTISFSEGGQSHWKLISESISKTVKVKPSLIANNFPAILNLTLLGNGISLIPVFLAEKFVKSGELIHILKPWTGIGSNVQILMPNQTKIPNRIRKFFDFANSHLSGRI